MPPSAFTSSEKSLIKTVLSSSSTKIITATPARVYVAHPTPDKWYYTGVEGALVFVREGANLFYFRLVDLKVRILSLIHRLQGKLYGTMSSMKTFTSTRISHIFTPSLAMCVVQIHTQEYMIGLCYADEAGASQIYKKVQNRAKYGTLHRLMDSQVELQLIGLWLREKTHELYGLFLVQ